MRHDVGRSMSFSLQDTPLPGKAIRGPCSSLAFICLISYLKGRVCVFRFSRGPCSQASPYPETCIHAIISLAMVRFSPAAIREVSKVSIHVVYPRSWDSRHLSSSNMKKTYHPFAANQFAISPVILSFLDQTPTSLMLFQCSPPCYS